MRFRVCRFPLLLSMLFSLAATAAPGDFVTTFGAGGLARINVGSTPTFPFQVANHVTADKTGKIWVAGTAGSRAFFTRLLPDGQPDTTLEGGAPFLTVPSLTGASFTGHLTQLQDNAEPILLYGYKQSCANLPPFLGGACSNAAPELRMLRPVAGSLTEYGGGLTVTRLLPHAVTSSSDGGYTAIGYSGYPIGNTLIARVDANGQFDTAFATRAMPTVLCDQRGLRGSSLMTRDRSGRLVTAVLTQLTVNDGGTTSLIDSLCLARQLEDGSPDPTYGANGQVLFSGAASHPFYTKLLALLARPEGGVALVSEAFSGWYFIKFFSEVGAEVDAIGPSRLGIGHVTAAAIQPDGKILLAGYPHLEGIETGPDHSQPSIIRVLRSRSLDPTFGESGKALLVTNGQRFHPVQMHLDHHGSIFLAGKVGLQSFFDPGDAAAVAKLTGGDPITPTPIDSGGVTGGGGGGCGTIHRGPLDPTFPALLLMAIALAISRSRRSWLQSH